MLRAVAQLLGGGSPGVFTSLTATGLFTQAGEDSITAFATGGQTSATALSATKNLHRVSVCATAGDSVKLPAALVGQAHYVRNDGATACQVFGQATETIDGVASATGVPLAIGQGRWYVCTTAGAWTSTGSYGVGTAANPELYLGTDVTTGWYRPNANQWGLSISGSLVHSFTSNSYTNSSATAQIAMGASGDAIMTWATTNSFRYSAAAASTATSRTEMNKAVTAFTDAAAKTVFTFTIPNAAHSASFLVRVTGSLGAGGAIGANEASATNCYVVTFTRTAGLATTAAISSAFGAAATAVAGAATVTCTAALAAVSGANSATQTIDLQATITRSGGSSANHTCVATTSLLNANATGITVA
jgi:hypothetical protein